MYGYIYKTTNLINGKIYIGQHKWNKESIDENYKGSGFALKKAINKYGYDNFQCIIIDKADSYEELNEKEIFWILTYDSTNPEIGYNLDKGGKATYRDTRDVRVIQKIKETKARMHCYTDGNKNKWFWEHEIIPSGWVAGQHRLTDEEYSKRTLKARSTKEGKTFFTNGIDDIWCKWEDCPEGYYRGKSNIQTPNKGKMCINNGIIQKYILKTSPIPDGWFKGGIKRHDYVDLNKFKTAKDKIWITNGRDTKYIKNTDLVPEGWWKGRTFKRKDKRSETAALADKLND